ncbi:hypothetical protein CHU98_g9576 [Xylaria longipes]|nr:hypothetical protein CHU98_g9576 [Xylaria longipes]
MDLHTNLAQDDNIPITQHIHKILTLMNLTTHILVPVTAAGCTLECYKDLMELPAVCTVQHAAFCGCRDPDVVIVQQYLGRRYAAGVEVVLTTSDWLRTFQGLIHELCEEFGATVEGGFEAPQNVPDPRGVPP